MTLKPRKTKKYCRTSTYTHWFTRDRIYTMINTMRKKETP